jgi:hypothetical protein
LNKLDIIVLAAAAVALVLGVYFGHRNWSAIGLSLDIAGFLLLWRFGLPSDLKPGGKIVGTEWDVTFSDSEKKRFEIAGWVCHISVGLVLAGFVLQFVDVVCGSPIAR